MGSEDLAIYNSIATAEGAIAEAITKSGRSLHHSQCLVLGYGRCAKTLSSFLKGLSCRLTVCARRPEILAEAAILADNTVNFESLPSSLEHCDHIFNTVPALVLQKEHLKKLPKHTVIIDIASSPGGVDYAAARELNIPAYLCPGLPGKYSPVSSGEAIAKIVSKYNLIDKE